MSCSCMSLSLLSPGLNVVPRLRVICDLRAICDVVPESGLSHVFDVNLERVLFNLLVPRHTRLADVVVTTLIF